MRGYDGRLYSSAPTRLPEERNVPLPQIPPNDPRVLDLAKGRVIPRHLGPGGSPSSPRYGLPGITYVANMADCASSH